MYMRPLPPAARPSRLAGPMQLHRPTSEIPELGGLLPSRLNALAARGAEARAEIEVSLRRARRRARGLAILRVAALLGAGALFALCAGAMVGSFAPAMVARAVVLALVAASLAGVAVFTARSTVQRAGLRDDIALARLLAGPSDLLSSVEMSRAAPEPGISRDLLALLDARAAAQAGSLDVREKLPLSSAGLPL